MRGGSIAIYGRSFDHEPDQTHVGNLTVRTANTAEAVLALVEAASVRAVVIEVGPTTIQRLKIGRASCRERV